MNSKTKVIIALSIFVLMVVSTVAASPASKSILNITDINELDKMGGRSSLEPINKDLLENPPKTIIGGSQFIGTLGVQWNNSPSGWWDTDWEYRINITLTEPGIGDRANWPVDVYIKFDPPAFKYSIRVIKVTTTGYTEIPYQPWNLTYYNDTHLSSATITFLVNLLKGESAVYQIYWSTSYKDLPNYPKVISVTEVAVSNGVKYIISSISKGWSVEIPPDNGGLVMNITLPNGEKVGHSVTQFGVTRNPTLSYNGFEGEANTFNLRYTARYIDEKKDPLIESFMGVVFVTYVVEGAPLYQSNPGVDIAKVDYYMRFYSYGIFVKEKLYSFNEPLYAAGTYYLGGWVFDQDDSTLSTFDKVYSDGSSNKIEKWTIGTSKGTITSTWSAIKVYDEALSLPVIRAFRKYLSAGSYTLTLSMDANSSGDDPWVKIFDPKGNLIASDYYWNGLSLSFTASTDGYYYILVGVWDDDTAPDTLSSFTISVGAYSWHTIVRSATTINEQPNTYVPPDTSIFVSDYNVTNDVLGYTIDINATWTPTTDDIDAILFDSSGNVLYYDISTTGSTIRFTLTPTAIDHLTVLLVKYSGSTSTSVVVNSDNVWGPEYIDLYGYANDAIAFYHSTENRAIGMFNYSVSFPAEVSSRTLIWYNEGNDTTTDNDYIYWSYNISLTGVPSSPISIAYYVVPWTPSGTTDAERVSDFVTIEQYTKNPITVAKNAIERFKIKLNITVIDNDNKPVPNAEVNLIYTGNGSTLYSSTTNASGIVVINAIRYPYTIEVRVTSAGRTYVNNTITVDYSTYSYTVHSDSRTIKMKNIVRIAIKALTNATTKTIIQNGRAVFTNTANTSDYIETYTNLTGFIDIYIPTGSWELAFNATNTSVPDPWDRIRLYNDSTLNYPVTAASINVTLSITEGFTYYLVDGDITSQPDPTRLVLFNSLTYYDVYWGEIITIKVNLTNVNTGNNIDGSIYYYVYDSSNNLYMNGTATQISTGTFKFQINTTKLKAGIGYTIEVNGTSAVANTLDPSPLNIGLNVKERPLSIDVAFSPGTNIYWNESLTVSVTVDDSILGVGVSGVDVTMKIYGSQVIVVKLDDLGGGYYEKTIPGLNLSVIDTGTFTVQIVAQKLNYEIAEKTASITIMERPTMLVFSDYVELPWTNTYTLTVQYMDSRYNIPVVDANVTYILKEAGSGTVISVGTLTLQGAVYTTSIDLTGVMEGTYIIEILAGKKNYVNTTGVITFILREHYTQSTQTTTKLTVYYNENVTIKFTYYDTDYNQYITGATTKTALIAGNQEGLPSITKDLIDQNNGTYVLTFNTSELGALGSYTITITIYKQHYTRQVLQVSLVIKAIPTSATVDKTSLNLEWKDNITLNMEFKRTIVFKGGIENADNHTYSIYKGGTVVAYGTLIDLGNGKYKLNLNTTQIGTGSFLIYVFFEQSFHQNQTLIISLTVSPIITYAYTDYDSISLIWGYSQDLTVYYNRSRNGEGISGASLTVDLINATSGKAVGALSWIVKTRGVYIVPIDASKINPGSYIINITITKGNYTTQKLIVTLTISPVPTIGITSTSNITIYWGDTETVEFTYLRTDTGKGVSDAAIVYYYTYFENGSLIGKQIVSFTGPNGSIEITFTANGTFVPGAYVLTITAYKTNYEPVTVTISINVNKRPINAVLSSSSLNLVWGDKSNLTLVITDGITGKALFLTSNDIRLSTDLNGTLSVIIGEGIYYIVVDTTKLSEPVSIPNIFINITKVHYIGKTLSFSLSVSPVIIEASLSGPNSVTLNPISGGSTTYRVGLFDKSRGGVPVSEATVKLVLSTGANSYALEMTKVADEPGYYQVTVNWNDLPIFRPGEDYSVSVEVDSISVNGVSVPSNLIGSVVSVDVKGTTSTNVDYYGGTTELPGLGRVPALIAYPIIIVVLVVGSIVGYRIVSYMMLPPEVKELDKLIKQIEKDNYDYEAPTREETIRKLLEGEL